MESETTPSFLDRWQELEWDDIGMQIRAKTAADVARALSAPRRTLSDFMALISPAAEAFLSQMAAEAERLTASVLATPSASMCRSICRTFAPTTAPTAASP